MENSRHYSFQGSNQRRQIQTIILTQASTATKYSAPSDRYSLHTTLPAISHPSPHTPPLLAQLHLPLLLADIPSSKLEHGDGAALNIHVDKTALEDVSGCSQNSQLSIGKTHLNGTWVIAAGHNLLGTALGGKGFHNYIKVSQYRKKCRWES